MLLDFGFLDNYVKYLLLLFCFLFLFVRVLLFFGFFLLFLGIIWNNVDCFVKYFGVSRSSNGFCHCTMILKYGAPFQKGPAMCVCVCV